MSAGFTSEFHSRDGVYFASDRYGNVRVRFEIGKMAHATVLTPSEWASVVASMSARGEDGETHAAALARHVQAVT